MLNTDQHTYTAAIPTIDLAAPTKVETATFALG